MRTIAKRCWNADQSWKYEHTVEAEAHTLRVKIVRNAYDNQSSAKVDRFDGTEWKNVVYWPIEACNCKSISYVTTGVTVAHFAVDDRGLLAEAFMILRIKESQDDWSKSVVKPKAPGRRAAPKAAPTSR